MNKFKTGEKWLRSDDKVCLIIEALPPLGVCDQDGVWYSEAGLRQDGLNLVSRIISDNEAIRNFIEAIEDEIKHGGNALCFGVETLKKIAYILQAQSNLLKELKQLISDSGEKGAAMIKKIDEL